MMNEYDKYIIAIRLILKNIAYVFIRQVFYI